MNTTSQIDVEDEKGLGVDMETTTEILHSLDPFSSVPPCSQPSTSPQQPHTTCEEKSDRFLQEKFDGLLSYERKILKKFRHDFSLACHLISRNRRVSNVSRARKWLNLGVGGGSIWSETNIVFISTLNLIEERIGELEVWQYKILAQRTKYFTRSIFKIVGSGGSDGEINGIPTIQKWIQLAKDMYINEDELVDSVLYSLSLASEVFEEMREGEIKTIVSGCGKHHTYAWYDLGIGYLIPAKHHSRAKQWLTLSMKDGDRSIWTRQACALLSTFLLSSEPKEMVESKSELEVLTASEESCLASCHRDLTKLCCQICENISPTGGDITRMKLWLQVAERVGSTPNDRGSIVREHVKAVETYIGRELLAGEMRKIVYNWKVLEYACYEIALSRLTIEDSKLWLRTSVEFSTEKGRNALKAEEKFQFLSTIERELKEREMKELDSVTLERIIKLNNELGTAYLLSSRQQENIEKARELLDMACEIGDTQKGTHAKRLKSLLQMIDRVVGVVRLEDYVLLSSSTCFTFDSIICSQPTVELMRRWAQLTRELDPECMERLIFLDCALQFGSEKHRREEAIYRVRRLQKRGVWNKVKRSERAVDCVCLLQDLHFSRSRQFLVKVLFSGSLRKNKDSSLYRSFFRSGLREVHLLPLITRYVEKDREEYDKEKRSQLEKEWYYASREYGYDGFLALFDDVSVSYCFDRPRNRSFPLFLPLLLSSSNNLKEVTIDSFTQHGRRCPIELDLSCFVGANTSNLTSLSIKNYDNDLSLSPLSFCDFSSLEVLSISRVRIEGLEGLTPNNTRSLKELSLIDLCFLVDISSLSLCDLSSLVNVTIVRCSKLISLSPLSKAKGFAPYRLKIRSGSIRSSGISDFNLSRLKEPLDFPFPYSERSYLEEITQKGVEWKASNWKFSQTEVLEPPLIIGNVTVTW